MRVIGLPGDRIDLQGGHVVLNGSVLPDTHGPTNRFFNDRPAAWVVPEASVFVLGDARSAAADSRGTYGFVPKAALIGTTSFRCGPANRRGPIG
jgi:signal peptidase I